MHLSKRAILNTSLGLVTIAGLVGAYFFIFPPAASTSDGATQLTATVQEGVVSNTITASGSISPVSEVTASFPVSGTIASVKVSLGQKVAAGATLGTLVPTALQNKLNEVQTQYNNAVANLTDARSALAAAKTASTQTAGTTGGNVQSVSSANAAVRSAEAQVQTAYDSLTAAKTDRSGTTLKAPIAGLVIGINGSVGSSTGSASTGSSSSGFVTIADVSAMTVTANIAEADIASVTVDQAATVTFPAVPGVTADAKVTAIAPTATASNSVVTYATTITLSSVPDGVRLGETASVAITTKSSAATALYVPAAAITTANGVSTVKVVDASDPTKTTTVTVTLGVVGNTGTEVTSGLTVGETVVLGMLSATTSGTGSSITNRRGGFGGFGGGTGGPPQGGNG